MYEYTICDMMGRIIKKGDLNEDYSISVKELKEGAYLLFLEGADNQLSGSKFFKIQ